MSQEKQLMKHWLVGLSLVLGVFFIAPTPVAHAWSWSSWFGSGSDSDSGHTWSYASHGGSSSSVPELDPSAAGSAVVLLLGGVAYVLSRRRDEDLT
jgi:hypothetical protein